MSTFRRPPTRKHPRQRATLRLDTLEERTVPALGIGVNQTLFGSISVPPIGNSGAVGTNHYVQFESGRMVFLNKSGTILGQVPDDTFWQNAGISSTVTGQGLSQPHVVYDVLTDRWFAMEINLPSTGNQILVARSNTNDPTGTWKAVAYTGIAGQFANFPTLALDANGVYIGSANFFNRDTPFPMGVTMTSIPKADLLLATPTLANRTTRTEGAPTTMGWAPQGVTNFNLSPTHASIVATDYTAPSQIDRTTITGTGGAGATFGPTSALSTTVTSLPGKVRQPDGTQVISGGDDDRYTGAIVQVGDLIYAAHGISVNSAGVPTGPVPGPGGTTNAVHLVVIRDSTNQVVAQGTYYNSSFDYFFPSVAANQYGDILLGFNRSGPAQGVGATDGNIGAYAVYARINPTNPASTITFGQEVQLKAGQANNYHQQGQNPEVWGTYSATGVDPSNPLAFWTTQEFPQSNVGWTTQLSQIFVSPRASSVSSSAANGTYGAGAVIPITISFNNALTVTGTPQLALNSGGTAVYASGSGTSTLTFTYTVGAGQSVPDLDYASASALTLNGGTIKDAISGLDAELILPAPGTAGSLGANKNIVIQSGPAVTGVTSPTANGTYGFGAAVSITVTFTNAVVVTGTPQLALNSGGTAAYASGTGSNTLTFTYTVGAGQAAADLDYASTSALTLNGGTIKEQGSGADASLVLPTPGAAGSLGASKDIVIDAQPPTVSGVSSTSANGTYGIGAAIPITVTFNHPVAVTGVPQLALNSGGTAAYASGSGTATLTFTYTVGSGQSAADLDYSSTSSLTLNGGTITEVSSGQNANLTLPAPGAAGSLGAGKDIAIDTRALVTNVTSPMANASYGVGVLIDITIQFNRVVNVTGTPQLVLNSGGTAGYLSGGGTTTLTFRYTVGTGQSAADLDYASTAALSLNGGTIKDTGGQDANITLPAPGTAGSLGANKGIVIDTSGPTILEFRALYGTKKYNLIGSTRFDLPWRVTGIQVVFSDKIATGNLQSLSGLTATRFTGRGTNTLTWNFLAISKGSFNTALANIGPNALKDAAGNPIAAFSKAFRVLYGDFNDDGVVNAADEAGVRANLTPPYQLNPVGYNIFADLSGDGLVNLVDVGIARTRKGASLP
jgi:hypothetical protein